MSDTPVTVDDSAERAYAEAADAVAAKVNPAQPARAPKASKPAAPAPSAKAAEPLPVETPAVEIAAPVSEAPAPEPAAPVAKATTAEPLALPGLRAAPAEKAPSKAAAKAPAKVTAKAPAKVAAEKPALASTKAASAPAAKPVAAPATKKIKAKQPATAPKIARQVVKPTIKPLIAEKPKDTAMTKTTKTTKITDSIKSLASDAQEKAKSVIEKGSTLIGETTEFTKGNVAAVVESGKILASGLQQIGSAAVTDTKDAISTIQSDFKELASVKSPTELIEVQNGLMHRNFDRAIAYNSKASETFLKLANDMMAPISGRFSLAMQKVRKAA